MARRTKPRRGVLLLVVLSILVLFVLTSLTFIVVAGHYHRGAISASPLETTGDEPSSLLDRAMYELVRDTTNAQSSIGRHSLLNDLYGNDGFVGRILGPAGDTNTSGQIVQFRLIVEAGLRQSPPQARPADYYNGAVMTMTSGRARGLSARIIRSRAIVGDGSPNGSFSGTIFAEAFLSDQNEFILPENGDRFVVNGVPFNGAGFGYNPNTGRLDLGNPLRIALQPHFKAHTTSTPFELGGADESYDAVDVQNLFLAKVPTTAGDPIIPSFHQPALIRYWMEQGLAQLKNRFGDPVPPDVLREFLRPFVLRPTPLDHPFFTGSNPAFGIAANDTATLVQILLQGPWDVDNDSDGVPDSVWLDLGFPTSATGDGRLFRPLFAILCTDLDGRLNLNVHGSLAQIGLLQSITRPGADSISINGVAVRPPRGLGYGPAEVNFADVFGPSFGPAAYENVLRNRYADPAGRLETSTAAVPGFVAGERLGVLKVADVPTDYEAPARAPVGNALPEMSAYGSPPDLHGRGAVLLDFAGQPQFIAMGQPDETINNPYELDVINRSGSDSIYGVGDLERLLRAGDADAPLLPNRLRRVAWGAFAFAKAQQDGRLVTTHSFHLPVPNIQLPAYLRQSLAGQAGTSAGNGAQPPLADVLLASQGGLSSSATVVSWMYARLLANRVPEATIPDQLRLMLPFEIRHGGKMDINRPWADTLDEFGRGDINGDGQVDGERAVQLAFNTVLNRTGQSLVSDYRNDDESRLARYAVTRQIYARHLYCLAMMLLAPDYVDPTVDTNVTPQQAVELTARRMAQWAINAVDFRDADAIMTPFEFDVNPMNGWQLDIDGDPATFEGGERRIVWGCEYPHLLLTETMAFHDTRLKDSDWDTGSGKRRDEDGDGTSNPAPPDEEDEDLDQFRIPEGSFFAELYCTFDANNRHPQGTTRIPPRELYQYDSTDGLWKLDVGRVPLEQRRDRAIYPVWRLAISRPHSPGESVFAKLQARPDTTTLQPQAMDYFAPQEIVNIDRIVWFTSVRPAATTFERERIFWNWLNMPTGVAGKGYAVVGPRTKTFLGSSQANSPSGSQLTNRLIELDAAVPGAPGGNAVRTLPNYPQIGLDVKKAIGIVAAMDPPAEWTNNLRGRSIGVNVSEPLATGPNYYREPRHRITNPGPYPVIDAYAIKGETAEKMPDEPFDGQPNRPLADLNLAEGTVQNFRTVFLQRLANPLRPWNPAPGHPGHQAELPVNPYLTVDWMPVDLTVFNGEERRPANWNGPDWQWPGGRIDPDIRFSTRERGVTGRQIPDVFSWSITQLQNTNPVVRSDFFEHNMTHTLGFLNSTYGLPRAAGNAPYYAGDPRLPFPWLTWNDRPYANHFELMLVPASSPSRLGLEFTTETRQDPYRGNTVDNLRAPFEHLLNFFHSSRTPRESPNLCQLFDMVEVPSRFVGTEQWYNPMFFARQANEFNTLNRPIFTFRPPFNKLSRFRDPGRVNINTINDIRVWQAIAHGFPRESSPAFWDNLVRSRRGYNLGEEGRFPTEIANPFRSSLGADLQFELVGLDKPAVEATLLRSDPDNADVPLFEYDSRQVHDDTGRNPYFRYQFLRRLANVVTNHSNVFAVWITVGYFEVDPQTGQLGQELNSDTGDVKRHRSFYIIDRSIPVAFEPGENHNVDRAVLLRRFIE